MRRRTETLVLVHTRVDRVHRNASVSSSLGRWANCFRARQRYAQAIGASCDRGFDVLNLFLRVVERWAPHQGDTHSLRRIFGTALDDGPEGPVIGVRHHVERQVRALAEVDCFRGGCDIPIGGYDILIAAVAAACGRHKRHHHQQKEYSRSSCSLHEIFSPRHGVAAEA